MPINRRQALSGGAALAAAAGLKPTPLAAAPAGPFAPTWESLVAGYSAPDWFRDAKLGFWAHWGAQSVPSAGGWYARELYMQGSRSADHHRRVYGHPADKGYMEVLRTWRADRWDPDGLVGLYKNAGARYFVALANHHDNFDNYASTHHEWNSVRVGPGKDLIAGWAKAAKAHGLPFGVSNHSAHAWHWFQSAYGYDLEGARAGERYDAWKLTRAAGRGQWWDGLDPQALYTGRTIPMPDGYREIAAANEWHGRNDGVWNEYAPLTNPEFVRRWLLRCIELAEKYEPDLIYFDNFDLPLEQAGLDFTAWFYNESLRRNGRLDAVVTAKAIPALRRPALVEDHERGVPADIEPQPWQTDTCIGDWFYDEGVYQRGAYKNARTVIHLLADVVAKNGNLLLSIPVRGDGSIDDKEETIVAGIGAWMTKNGAAIYATRPWRVYGEGPNRAKGGQFSESQKSNASARDVRYTQKGGTVNAILLGWPDDGVARLTEWRSGQPGDVRRVRLVAGGDNLAFTRTGDALAVTLPSRARDPIGVALSIEGSGLTA